MKTKIIFLFALLFCNVITVLGQSEVDYKTADKILRKKIKSEFKAFSVGDTVRIPYSTSFKDDGTERTFLIVYSAYKDADRPYSNNENYDCIIKGVIVAKNNKREKGYDSKGYNLTYKVLSINGCGNYPIIYDGKEVVVGELIKHNMRWYKVFSKNTAANSGLPQ